MLTNKNSKREGTWDQLLIHPMTLMRMVIDGEATVIGKDPKGRFLYRLETQVEEKDVKDDNRV